MTFSYQRGHKIFWNGNEWLYLDNKKSIKIERPCIRCKRMPTKERYDACLECIEGVKSACCGHGISKPILKAIK